MDWWWREDMATGMAVLIMMLICAGALVVGDVTGN